MANASLNLASKYAKKVDERFTRESQAMLALNTDYKWTGVKTLNVYSIPTAPMNDYTRSGDHRYGTPNDLSRNVQTMTVTRDRAFTFIIDKGDKTQSQMVMDAGKALGRQLKEVWVPEFDSYVFRKLAAEATRRGNFSTVEIKPGSKTTQSNAYSEFLKAMEFMGNHNVPDSGRVCFCSYGFANLLMLDPAFVKQGDASQEMTKRGILGEVDGCKIVRVPSSRLPAGCAFLLTHKIAACAPKQLEEYKTHDNPPGISGWLVEGRVIYDCFVLEEKADAIYYHGSQPVLSTLDVQTVPVSSTEHAIMVNPGEPEAGHTYKYKLGNKAETVTTATNVSTWTTLTKSGLTVTTTGNTYVTVAEMSDTDSLAKAVGGKVLTAIV